LSLALIKLLRLGEIGVKKNSPIAQGI